MITFIYRTDEGEESPMSVSFGSIEEAYTDLCLNDWEPDDIILDEEDY